MEQEQFPSRVWLVIRSFEYEGDDVDSIWSTPELADARFKTLLAEREPGASYTYSTTWFSIDKVDPA